MPLIKSLRVLSPASNWFLGKEELQPLYSLVNSATKNISEDFLDAELNCYCEKHCLIKAS